MHEALRAYRSWTRGRKISRSWPQRLQRCLHKRRAPAEDGPEETFRDRPQCRSLGPKPKASAPALREAPPAPCRAPLPALGKGARPDTHCGCAPRPAAVALPASTPTEVLASHDSRVHTVHTEDTPGVTSSGEQGGLHSWASQDAFHTGHHF
uniref:Uncharacterized protein n=1 Tax=Mustela putorius furo TaxID=9669 RepID=M3YSQ3_MUSPF